MFPPGTGLGLDNFAPIVVGRLSEAARLALATLLMAFESWCTFQGLVMIVFLPKTTEGFRPIGLFPTVIKLWMHSRILLSDCASVNLGRPWDRSALSYTANNFHCRNGNFKVPRIRSGAPRHCEGLRPGSKRHTCAKRPPEWLPADIASALPWCRPSPAYRRGGRRLLEMCYRQSLHNSWSWFCGVRASSPDVRSHEDITSEMG